MAEELALPLADIEPRLRPVLPAELYAQSWVDQSGDNLESIFEHLRTLLRILYDYVPPQLAATSPQPGVNRSSWEEGALMFTDLSGFTPLLEANAGRGTKGARVLLGVLNSYFAEMIEVVSKSGGELLEFTGDALLIEFPKNRRNNEVSQAVRAGLRMQRAMKKFENIETDTGTFKLGQRIGIHSGRFLTADIGTPHRMEHVLLGTHVQESKKAEGAGIVSRVNLTSAAWEKVKDEFRFEKGKEKGYKLVVDDLSEEELGTYDITLGRRRMASGALFDRSVEGLMTQIGEMLGRVEPMAAFIPDPVMGLLVESAAKREIPPDFPLPTIMFVNLIGLPESVDTASEDEVKIIVERFSQTFAQINAAVEKRGGVLKKVTYHLTGSDMMIMFGVPVAHSNDPIRAADAALAIRDIVLAVERPEIQGRVIEIKCRIGMSLGPVFAAEIGEPRGRREFNALGDTVNTAARLMGSAGTNMIYMTEDVHEWVKEKFECADLGELPLKGKSIAIDIFELKGHKQEEED